MSNPQRHQGSREDESAFDAAIATLQRTIVPALIWVARFTIVRWLDSATVLVLSLDAFLVASHWWANAPLRTAMGHEFGQRRNQSGWFLAALVAAVLLLVRDVVYAWGGSL